MTPHPSWDRGPDHPVCDGGEIHVWRASLAVPPRELRRLARMLSPGELERAERFRFAEHRGDYLVARGLLRVILAGYLRVHPEAIRFRYGPWGKPALDGEGGGGGLRFNLAHSHGVALFSVSRGRETGVDLERIHPAVPGLRAAARWFPRQDVARLRGLAGQPYAEGFLACWTRREAYLKARGDGLTGISTDPEGALGWGLYDLAPWPGYVGALAVEGTECRVACWDLPAPWDRSERVPAPWSRDAQGLGGPSHGRASEPPRSARSPS